MFVSRRCSSIVVQICCSIAKEDCGIYSNASINEEHTQYVVDGKTALKYLGLVVKELGALCDEKSIPQIIKDSDRIYISERGNSFFFTYGLRRTELIVDSRGCWKRKSFYW